MTTVDQLFALFRARGSDWYSGERISQLEHALQCAHLADQAGEEPGLIVACLLHDLGHLLSGLPEDAADRGQDDHHEGLGARHLAKHFVAAVTEPVRLHVEAKRYRCATEPDYFGRLSEASVRSLELQGGPMPAAEARRFEEEPFAKDALRLRGYDDAAKVVGAVTPDLEHFRPVLEAMLR